MQKSQDTNQGLANFTVAIQKAGCKNILGTGVMVTDDGLIVTCYHVVGSIQTKSLDDIVDIRFPLLPEIKRSASPVKEYCDPKLDIAFLQLQGDLPPQITVANLSKKIAPTHTFWSFGFRREKTFDGLYSDGTIQGEVRKKFKEYNNLSLQEVIQLRSDAIHHGMSGAAVPDTQINRVIGVISEYLATSSNVDKNLALAIPVDTLLQIYPELNQKNPGLKILEFLRRIGLEGNTWYQRIEDVYIPQ
jgi:S1-C subfamily serine protease